MIEAELGWEALTFAAIVICLYILSEWYIGRERKGEQKRIEGKLDAILGILQTKFGNSSSNQGDCNHAKTDKKATETSSKATKNKESGETQDN